MDAKSAVRKTQGSPIRNTAAHGLGELTQQEAVERLSVLSLLARWVDECNLIEAGDPAADGS